MIYAIVLLALVAVTAGGISLWNVWVLNMHRSGGPYASSTGAYTYRKFGIWHIGFRQSKTDLTGDSKLSRTSAVSNHKKSELPIDEWLGSNEWERGENRWKKERQPISTT
jgi:hypothetical protein